ncbi:DegT/DnrJ/EryC1/StrS family aminotransferase [Litorilinea aerophila]|uniref:DegT/DnrJ/EryC1/StrS family aminotransferase n=1 Tax=Litorilinea aerophila TaxID=1204385 RepID=A0A540VL08_9CHLR|nr:DegT/DnrJ/EryC1/StrS family aminotransferase [Litorilinea aerophila]MCC9075145.1 DegT/DnrJ/EryC1/StrS family aminotransferase [Litorilinea aerophila]
MTAPKTRAAQLAVHGGEPVRRTPFPPRGHFGPEEKAAVDALLEQAMATGVAPGYNGPEEEAYCREFAAYLGGGFVDGVNSGTSALYVALKALALEPFSEVIVAAVTDPGGMMPIPLLNLIPMVADTAPGSFNTGPEQVEALITPLTRAIVVSHIGGEPADMPGILTVAERHGLPVIEDASQAHGARLNGRFVGTFGTIGIFSTMSGKHHASGAQGGLIYTRDEQLYQAVRRAADRGKPFFLPPGSTNVTAGLNLNLNEIAAAIGRVQLRKLPEIVARRQVVVGKLAEGLADLATVSLPPLLDGAEASYWFLRLRFHPERAHCDKETYCRALAAEGLPINPSYRAALPHTMDWFVHRRVFGRSGYPWASPDYQGDRERQFPCPNAEAAMDTHFNLQLHENWGAAEIADALAIFRKVDATLRRD